jgi:hypothetical protein
MELDNVVVVNTCECKVYVNWSTRRLQFQSSRARFPVRPLDVLVYVIIPAAPWPWGLQPLTDMSLGNLPGAKGVYCA